MVREARAKEREKGANQIQEPMVILENRDDLRSNETVLEIKFSLLRRAVRIFCEGGLEQPSSILEIRHCVQARNEGLQHTALECNCDEQVHFLPNGIVLQVQGIQQEVVDIPGPGERNLSMPVLVGEV